MTTEIHCPCGAVALRLDGEPLQQFYCHCDDCRAMSGGAYVPVALFPAQAVTRLRGETFAFTLRTMSRHRCRRCGVQMLGEVPGMNLVGVRGDLLPMQRFAPAFHIHCRHAVRPVRDELPHYAGLPAVFGGTEEQVDW